MLEPAWTRDTVETAWRDPLRLYRVGQRLLNALMPSFTAVTAHAPYYWLYPWAIWSARDGSAAEARRLSINVEKAYVLASLRNHAPNDCPLGAGVQGSSLITDSALESSTVALADLPWLGNLWGGLGQQYLGPLERTGLLERPAGVPVITSAALEICTRADRVLRETPLLRVAMSGEASSHDLDEIAAACCPCQAADNFASVSAIVWDAWERVRAEEPGGNSQANLLAFLKHLDDFASEHGFAVTGVGLRPIVYSGVWQFGGEAIPLATPPDLQPVQQTLRMILASHYAVHAFEGAFRGVLLAIRDGEVNLAAPADEVVRLATEAGFTLQAKTSMGELWRAMTLPEPWQPRAEAWLDARVLEASSPGDCIAYSFLLLLTLLARYRDLRRLPPGQSTPADQAWAALWYQSERLWDDLTFVHLYNRWRDSVADQAIPDLTHDLTLLRHRHYVRQRGVPSLWVDYQEREGRTDRFEFRLDYDRAGANRPSWRVDNVVWMLKQMGRWKSEFQQAAAAELESDGELESEGAGDLEA